MWHGLIDYRLGMILDGLAAGVCPKAEHAVARTSVAVNKETTAIAVQTRR
jgi:hypothetical protein